MEKSIFFKDVLAKMREKDSGEKPIPFSIEWRTFNKQNKMGGKLKIESNAILCMKSTVKKNIVQSLKFQPIQKERKNPNHWDNKTRNIELSNGEVKTIGILTITKFNGLNVVP